MRSNVDFREGVSMIETMVAVLILGVIGTALMLLTVSIQGVSNSAKMKSLSEGYAERMLEQVRGQRAQGWSSLQAGCFPDGNSLGSPLGSCPPSSPPQLTDNRFNGYVQLTCVNLPSCSPPGYQVRSVVKWTDKGATKTTELDTYLYDY